MMRGKKKYGIIACIIVIIIIITAYFWRVSKNESTSTLPENDELIVGNEIFKEQDRNYSVELRQKPQGNGYLTSFYILREDTVILKKSDYYPDDIKLNDINGDGNIDIVVSWSSTATNEAYVYNAKSKSFDAVVGFSDYANAIRVGSSNYFYSYERAGCADDDWKSYLFTVEGNNIIKIAEMDGKLCKDNTPKGIYVYIFKNNEPNPEGANILTPSFKKDRDIVSYWTNFVNSQQKEVH
ncbi:MAG: hypothetical protein JWN37_602 [Candidatus Nomurabacteria bacterium]|nr:hypothetical protein [Candidatus Nomurabacteria bacterium]